MPRKKSHAAPARRSKARAKRGPKTTPLNPEAAKTRKAMREGKGLTGRPSKLTPETMERIVATLQRGSYLETVAAFAGISKQTFYDWMKRGRADKEAQRNTEYARFLDSVEKAQAEAELNLLAIVHRGTQPATVVKIERKPDGSTVETRTTSPGEWTPAAWMLERKFYERWGRTTRVHLGGDKDAPPIRGQISVADLLSLNLEADEDLERL